MNTYYLTSKFKILYAIISILVLALLFKIFTPNYVCLGIYGAFILVTSFNNIVSEKIVISDKGIVYHRLGLTFNVKWENIKEINTYWSIPLKQEGIYIDPDLIRITEWWSGSYKVYGGGVEKHSFHYRNFLRIGATQSSDNISDNTRHIFLIKKNLSRLLIDFRRT